MDTMVRQKLTYMELLEKHPITLVQKLIINMYFNILSILIGLRKRCMLLGR